MIMRQCRQINILHLKGNCHAKIVSEFFAYFKRPSKIMTFAKNRRSKAYLEPKLWPFIVWGDDVIFAHLLENVEFSLYFPYKIENAKLSCI